MKRVTIPADDDTAAAAARMTGATLAPSTDLVADLAPSFAPSAVNAAFFPSLGLLTVGGNNADNTVVISRNATGAILVNDGAAPILGGTPTVSNTRSIQVFGLGGNDVIALDETNGALPAAQLFGGAGNDSLTGGSAADQLFGQSGNDSLLGKGGNDLLFGGDGNDQLVGGAGDDQMFGESGNDRFIWNPGDGSDWVDGGTGTDRLEVNGGNGAETFAITAGGTHVRLDRLTPAPFTIDATRVETIVLNANGGDDTITAGNGLDPLVQLILDGGAGNDTITGGDGNDTLLGGSGNDLVSGGRGNDVALLGGGDDRFVWNPGDGSDVVDGQAGSDTLQFNGANVGENMALSANGARVLMTRDVGTITMDLSGIETVNVVALGGADHIVVNDLSGTRTAAVNIDLSAVPGGATGDGQADEVELHGSAAAERIQIAGTAGVVTVSGTPCGLSLSGVDAGDTLGISGHDGNDVISAAALATDLHLVLDGGAGDDTLVGGNGSDMLLGGAGNDLVEGGHGNDLARLGDGNDTFVWNPGDGSDVVEGDAGNDTLRLNGANIDEHLDISGNGGRVQLVRDVGNVTMDLNGVEHLEVNAAGGSDFIAIGDLSGTDAKAVDIHLGVPGGGDGAADTVAAIGTGVADTVVVTSAAGATVVSGLAAEVQVSGADAGLDQLQINTLAGDDTIDASALNANRIGLTVNAGAGNDHVVGSAGSDLVNGGTGNDTALLGAGDDTFVWNPGDGSDVVDGQGGSDTLQFNAANVAEKFDISANADHLSVLRDVGNIAMDLKGVETVAVQAGGGADTITVHDLSGTDATQLRFDLGGGDGAGDVVVIEGTAGDDVIRLTTQNGALVIDGLATQVVIENFEIGDQIRVLGLGGDDVIEASGVLAGGPQLWLDGGAGNDVLIGGEGDDLLFGGDGDDVLLGGPGQDLLDGGPGDNVLIQ